VGIDHDVYTDPEVGDYHRMLLPGVYGVAFRAAGYYEETMTDIEVGEGSATRIDVTLDPLKKGDVNGDREVSLADAILALQIVAGIGVTDVYPGSDVDGDGRIGLSEALFCLSAIQ
jgi:carboxypeptidase D